MKFLSIILASILIASLVGLSNFDDAFADHMYRGGYVEHTSTTFEGFVIDYRNYGVEIKNIQADVDEKKLMVTIYTTANPAFVEIDVPRELLDAITDGVDQSFTVIYEGEVSNFEQVQTTDTYRTLNIPVGTKPPNHTSENQELQIIGTNIFGEVELPTDVWGKITRLYQQRYPYNDLLHIDAESNVIRDALCEKTFGEDGKKYYETSFSTDLQGTSTKFNAGQLHEIPYQKLRVELYTNNCVHLLDTEYFVWQGFPGDEPEPTPEPTPEPEPEPTPEPEPAPEPEPTLIFVYTDKSAYKHGEQIKIYGSVENIRTGILVTVTVISPTNNIVRIDQVSVNNYGEFSIVYSTSGNLWKYDGTYTIRAQYGNQAVSNKTLIELTGGIPPPSEIEQEDKQVDSSKPVCDFLIEIKINDVQWKIDGIYTITTQQGENTDEVLEKTLYTIALPVEVVGGKTLATNVSEDFLENIVFSGSTVNDDDVDQNRDLQGMRLSLSANEGSTTIVAKGASSKTSDITIKVTSPNGNLVFDTSVSCMDENEELPLTEQSKPTQRIPEWVKNIFIWYGDDLISEDELINALRFLIQEGTIQV